MLVYLAGPIDLVSKGESHAWREKFAIELAARGMSSFNPAAAFKFQSGDKATSRRLIEINRSAMMTCNFAVVLMGKDMPSIGTPVELYMLQQSGKPHVVIWEPHIDSFNDGDIAQYGPLPAYVEGLADHVVRRFDDALDYIVEVQKNFAIGADTSAKLAMNLDGIKVDGGFIKQ